ncbi:MAG: molybdate transporter family protein [Pseudobdellovibrio sp.]
MKAINNFLGAFSDGAILFPLVMTLSVQNGMNLSSLLLSSGVAYLIAGYIFQSPMSVQPLKSIAIAGLAIGASATEIRMAAAALGSIFIISLFFNIEAFAKKIPERLIHGIQVGLGLILVQQGLKYVLPGGSGYVLLTLVGVLIMLFINYRLKFPVLGLVASIGFFISLLWLKKNNLDAENTLVKSEITRPMLILSLVAPQLVLTSANSVLATVNVSKKYYGELAEKVTIRRLVCLIGFGNILNALFGGLPFCHGSGGVTAHAIGGAKTNAANYIIGFSLLVAASATFLFGSAHIIFNPIFISVLLITVGILHLSLAQTSWVLGEVIKLQLIMMGLAAVLFGNMLVVIGVGVVFEIVNKYASYFLERRSHD